MCPKSLPVNCSPSDQAVTTSETPYFCHSHLIMKINIGAPDATATAPNLAAFNEEARAGPLPLDLLQASGFIMSAFEPAVHCSL